MNNKNIISMRTNTEEYGKKSAIFGIIGIAGLISAFWILSLISGGHIYESDFLSVGLLCIGLFMVGGYSLSWAGSNIEKYAVSKKTFLIINQECVSGKANGREIEISISDIVSVSVQVCSLRKHINGVPKNMNPGISMKLDMATSKYLCIFTKVGEAYYIDTLSSPEIVKNTIDNLIAQNLANAKNA